jgi:hypothetical protein
MSQEESAKFPIETTKMILIDDHYMNKDYLKLFLDVENINIVYPK